MAGGIFVDVVVVGVDVVFVVGVDVEVVVVVDVEVVVVVVVVGVVDVLAILEVDTVVAESVAEVDGLVEAIAFSFDCPFSSASETGKPDELASDTSEELDNNELEGALDDKSNVEITIGDEVELFATSDEAPNSAVDVFVAARVDTFFTATEDASVDAIEDASVNAIEDASVDAIEDASVGAMEDAFGVRAEDTSGT